MLGFVCLALVCASTKVLTLPAVQIQNDLHHLFDSIAKKDAERIGEYRAALREESDRKKETFDAFRNEIRTWRKGHTNAQHEKQSLLAKRNAEATVTNDKVTVNGMLDNLRTLIQNFETEAPNNYTRAKLESIANHTAHEIPPIVDKQNETAVASFQRSYRLYFALLQTWSEPGGALLKFRRDLRTLANLKDYSALAKVVAQFISLLAQLKADKSSQAKVIDWEDEVEVIRAFKKLGVVDPYMQGVARAFYRSKPTKTTDKKIRIHAPDIEQEALTQFNDCYSKDFVIEAALMPDAHAGYVAPIGAVIKTRGAVVPAWVGYDIGCGMIAVRISDNATDQKNIQEKAKEIFNEVNRNVPMGTGGHNRLGRPVYLVDKMEIALAKLNASTTYGRLYKDVSDKSGPNLGTLGSGNHFIELSTYEDETWLVIHSGSRNVGHHVGVTFMKMVSGLKKGYDNTFPIKDPDMLNEYMYFQDYCLEFALLNRMSMAMKVEEALRRITGIVYDTYANLWTNKHHNHCVRVGDNLYLHRKGATSSDRGERGVIPGNMRDGCYLVEGLGNEDFLHSSSHGAGRVMSRTAAKMRVDLNTFKDSMAGIVAPVNLRTVEESPFAYKNISAVMEFQRESVKVIKHLKPIINWKGFN